MSNDQQEQNRKPPSHIAYQTRESADGQKSYFNRIGAVWTHKDGQGFNIQLDSVPVDGRITVRSVQERLQEAKDNAQGGQNGSQRDERRGSGREDRRERDTGPRYER
jgi:hypothetical protein